MLLGVGFALIFSMILSACDICEAKAAWNCNYDPVTTTAMKVTGVYLGDVLKSNLV
jgi:uncharacterized lipoprotein YehR (DUF1307 family)